MPVYLAMTAAGTLFSACFNAFLARRAGRDPARWAFFGVVQGVVPPIALAFVPLPWDLPLLP